MKTRLAIIILTTFIFTKNLLAATQTSRTSSKSSSSLPKGVYGGLGMLNFDAGVASSSASSGTKPFLYQTYTMLSLTSFHSLKGLWQISPIFDLTLIGRKTPEGKAKTAVTVLGARFIRPAFFSGFNFHLGPGLIFYRIDGSGGTVDLNNGSGVSTFGAPNETRASNSIYYDFGVGYQISKYRFELSILVTEPFKTTKRAISPIVAINREIF